MENNKASNMENNTGSNTGSSTGNNIPLAQQQLLFAQMQQSQLQAQDQDDEIDLGELWGAIWAGKLTIIGVQGHVAYPQRANNPSTDRKSVV